MTKTKEKPQKKKSKIIPTKKKKLKQFNFLREDKNV